MNNVKQAAALSAGLLALAVLSLAQTTQSPSTTQSLATSQADTTWSRVGATAVNEGLAGPATGQVTNVWYRGGTLLARTASGRVFETSDMSRWRLNTATIPPAEAPASSPGSTLPESGARVVAAGDRLYAAGANFVYVSRDGGASWAN